MMKLKVVENERLKVLTCVRTHPEELLAPKIWFSWFCEHKKARNEFRTIWQIKKCLDCHPESSQMCKNSSRPTPRPKIWFSWFFEHKRSRNEFITIRQNWKMLGLSFQNNLTVVRYIFYTIDKQKEKHFSILTHCKSTSYGRPPWGARLRPWLNVTRNQLAGPRTRIRLGKGKTHRSYCRKE